MSENIKILDQVLFNNTFGGFSFSETFLHQHNIPFRHGSEEELRRNPTLLEAYRNGKAKEMEGNCCKLKLAVIFTDQKSDKNDLIPYNECFETDISEYDGNESVRIDNFTDTVKIKYIRNILLHDSSTSAKEKLEKIQHIIDLEIKIQIRYE